MPDLRDMPPDPFAQDGVDPFAVEASERLAHDGASGCDPRWDRVGGEPTVDDFDDAEAELQALDHRPAQEPAPGPFTALLPWLWVIALVVVAALAFTYVLR